MRKVDHNVAEGKEGGREKNILDHDAERVTWQKREKIPENES